MIASISLPENRAARDRRKPPKGHGWSFGLRAKIDYRQKSGDSVAALFISNSTTSGRAEIST
jgi:hypothetical protein